MHLNDNRLRKPHGSNTRLPPGCPESPTRAASATPECAMQKAHRAVGFTSELKPEG